MKDPAAIHVKRANVAAEIGRHAVVERECHAALACDPQSHAAHELLAWSLMEQRRHGEALAVANQGLATRADSPALHYLAAVVLHRMGYLPAARIRAESAVSAAPRSARYRVRLARIALDQNQRDEALRLSREALADAGDEAFVLGEVALILCECGEPRAGRELARRRVQLCPDDVWASAGLLRASAACGEHEEAIATARTIIAREPNLGWVWSLLAEALDACGEHAAADAAAREALRLSPTTSIGGAPVARVLCDRGEWARAERAAKLAMERDPRNARAAALFDRARRRGVPLRHY